MAKIKFTKNELKTQRDALQRYQRYLPTLELKKAQLQIEAGKIINSIQTKEEEKRKLRDYLDTWVRLFSEDVDAGSYTYVKEVKQDINNIAGVSIPLCRKIIFERAPVDFFSTPAWLDDGIDVLERLVQYRIELHFLYEQRRLLMEELLITSQRVNLFEKIKIPETKENIRRIKIYLGDEHTSAVVRAKIAKEKSIETRGTL
ncbi:MAG: V-type ATP synthase subunit D [Candidatus Brocadiaceae bacterium]|nr:V-type ATP synthase subunit D [Candidatus Brocadiaceae bacterium]